MPVNSTKEILQGIDSKDPRAIGRAISMVENNGDGASSILAGLDRERMKKALVLGITGPPGAGKSTLTASIVKTLRLQHTRVGIIAVDPSSPISGGAILGDRIRMMDHATDPDVVIRSMATRGRLGGLCASAGAAVRIMAASGCEFVLIETVGVGQSEMDIVQLADITVMVLAPGFGDDIQAMKAGLLEVADFLVVNKADLPGTDALCMEMQQIFVKKEEESSIARVLSTIATENSGITKLLQSVGSFAKYLKATGIQQQRRNQALQSETMDWVFEMLQPHFLKQLQAIPEKQQCTDPRDLAKQLIEDSYRGSRL